jgi:hypothetical protein
VGGQSPAGSVEWGGLRGALRDITKIGGHGLRLTPHEISACYRFVVAGECREEEV